MAVVLAVFAEADLDVFSLQMQARSIHLHPENHVTLC